MYLKALELQGFKSFSEKTRLTFDREVTAIVGPNGSGKSNIADALLWVMGEQRTRTLRGGKMEDVIFGGTARRGAMGFAQVSLILDNSGRIFDVDSEEIMLTRRYYRSGESEYYLNRQTVRLKDITDLLMDTGLGRDGYSVIGQGRIAEIVSARSTDRREIFEEAAGIARYRHRKEEAERKLVRTDENLLRIGDKIDELALQVEPLRAQAETARRYLLLRDELRGLEISIWMCTLDRLQEQSSTIRAEYERARAELETAQRELEKLYAVSDKMQERMRELDLRAETLRTQISDSDAGAAECESAAAVLRTELRNGFETAERMRSELSDREDRARALEEQAEERRARIAAIDTERVQLEIRERELQRQGRELAQGMDDASRALAELMERGAALASAQAEGRTALSLLADAAQELCDRDAVCASELSAAAERKAEALSQLEKDEKAAAGAAERVTGLQNAIAGRQLLLKARETRTDKLRGEQMDAAMELRAVDDRIRLLTELERDYEGFHKAVRIVMRESERGILQGVYGPVARLMRTEDRYAVAIETALGGAMQHLVVETPEDGKAAIELLKRREAGRATFLPVQSIRGTSLRRLPSDEPGFVGLASELVQYEPRFGEIFRNLLGRTVLAETLGDAVRMAKRYDHGFRIVSLDGQVINAGGSMTGGSAGRGTGVLSRANELSRLRSRRGELAERAEQAARALGEAERERERLIYEQETTRSELDAAQEERSRCEANVAQGRQLAASLDGICENLESERQGISARLRENEERVGHLRGEDLRLEEALRALGEERETLSRGREDVETRGAALREAQSALSAELASLAAERAAALQTMRQFESLREELKGDQSRRQEAIRELERRAQDSRDALRERELRLADFRQKAEKLRAELAEATDQRLQLEGRRTANDRAAQAQNRGLLELERNASHLEQKQLSAGMEEKQIIDRLWDSYELSRSAAQAQRLPIENVAQANRRASELRREMSSLGTPNLGAIGEYERVSERYAFLTGQRDDVETARRELLGVITEITKEMEGIFLREFSAIGDKFQETFRELFGGGCATLQLEDEKDPLGCGIEIRVQPPGKALSAISLLSGGEKAFVAIALYFAMMKVRPTPFCVMDEIESALDEVNVYRTADYMRTMSARTQFIVITHRRGMMESADMLYGVTMQEKGVSNVLSMDMEQAMRMIAN